jgi:DNA-binding NarL/FixJ family response regulator
VAVAEIQQRGLVAPFEKEYLLKDGHRIPVMIGGVADPDRPDQGVSYVLDLRARKRAEAMSALAQGLPDVLVVDIALADINGIQLARQVVQAYPPVRILALTGYADRVFVEEMLKAGALGYVVKSAGVPGLIEAIHAVARGQRFLSPEAAAAMLRHLGQANPPVTVLTPREQEVLRRIARGGRSGDIAAELCISMRHPVTRHRRDWTSRGPSPLLDHDLKRKPVTHAIKSQPCHLTPSKAPCPPATRSCGCAS